MIYILLPIYNESGCISKLINSISPVMEAAGHDYKIIAVNDGSTDNTLDLLEKLKPEFPLEIVSHEMNRGLGGAIKTGFEKLFGVIKSGDIVISMDADNTHPVEIINKIAGKINEGAGVVVASRYCQGGSEPGVPFYRIVLSRGANWMLRFFFPYKGLKDYSSGYRGYNADVLLRAKNIYGEKFIAEKGFSVMAEIIIKLSFIKSEIKEVPLNLEYSKRVGRSKIRVFETIKNYFFLIAKLMGVKISLRNC